MYLSENWQTLYTRGKGPVVPVVRSVMAEVVEKKDRERDHWGEYIQGDSGCFMIFKVGDRYFKKEGYQSSYGDDPDWNGPVTEVFPKTKTIMVWE